MDRQVITSRLKQLQDDICAGLESLDGEGKFKEDHWDRPGGGGGRTRIIEGQHIEKGGVNFSAVEGKLTQQMQAALDIEDEDFFATGVSIVLHPSNPHVPIIHMNVRYFETTKTWWYGGGIDLTPHYINVTEASSFHQKLQKVCQKYNADFYPKFKSWADDYFYIKHRSETRGVGGIFFDKLGRDTFDSKEAGADYIIDVGNTFLPAYTEPFRANYQKSYSEHEKEWQLIRRGRYVEFNLVWDRGTKFGLVTDGRTESILMSLPKDARWMYDYQVTVGSKEEKTLRLLKKDINWLSQE